MPNMAQLQTLGSLLQLKDRRRTTTCSSSSRKLVELLEFSGNVDLYTAAEACGSAGRGSPGGASGNPPAPAQQNRCFTSFLVGGQPSGCTPRHS